MPFAVMQNSFSFPSIMQPQLVWYEFRNVLLIYYSMADKYPLLPDLLAT